MPSTAISHVGYDPTTRRLFVTFLGSGNWDARSLRLNFEFNVESYCAALGRHMDRLIVERRAASLPVTLADVNARPPAIKLRDGIARLFAPLL